MTPQTRNGILQFHRWAGLTVGLMILFMAITGATLIFRKQLEPLAESALLRIPACAARLPLDDLAAAVLRVHPAGRLDYVRIFGAADAAILFRFGNKDTVFLNPCTGDVLGQQNRFGGLFGALEFIHRFKFVDGGDLIAGVSALIFVVVIAIGGAAVWWPTSWRGLKASLKLNLRLRGRLRDVDLHRLTGAYAGIIILASALTGLPQAFDWYKDALYIIAGSPLPDRHFESKPDTAARLPMEAIWQHARNLVSSPAEALLHYPNKPDEAVEIYLIEKDAPHANARTYLFLDAYSNAVVSFTPYAESSPGHRLYFWTLSWHTGQAGLLGQVVLLFGALAVPVLAYTGIASYFARRRRAILLDQR